MQGAIRQLALEEFPPLLHEIPDPPESLRAEGTLPSNDLFLLTVVGSRKASPYGIDACHELVVGLKGAPISIISGLALGIDSIAHKAALEVGLHTVAVPGSGLSENVLYPATHRRLAGEILDAGGALVSEYEDDFKATSWSFPKRNRIMVGMSHAVLVIEAAKRSGTLITARLATEYNRDVLAVPGPIFAETSAGPLSLIKLGATPVVNSGDILEVFGLEEQNGSAYDANLLSPEEKEVVALLSAPIARDDLIEQLALPAHIANRLLSSLELKGLITESYGELRLSKHLTND